MSESEDAGKYRVENQQPVQGQVIGDHASVHIYNGPAYHPVPVAPPERLWTIPFQRNPFFLGQDDLLTQLHHYLTRKTITALAQIPAINGLGGIGKTQIAIEYAYRYRDTYPFVFWIRAERLETLITDLVRLSNLLQLPEQYNSDQMKIVAAVKQWLATQRGWLLIFDNADDLSQLSSFLPVQHPGAILLTTRASYTRPLAEPLLVEQMNERVGADFLLHRARLLVPGQSLEEATPADQRTACQLCQLVGGLPLALDQAGAYVDETQCSIQDYLNFYQQDQYIRTKLLQHRGKMTLSHPEPVTTTWALAFARVELTSPAAAELLRACAFLAPDLIPEDLLRQGSHCWGPALESVADNPFRWNETIGELLKYALVRRSREHHSLSIHRLVQTILKDAMDKPTYHQWIKHTIQAIEGIFPDGEDQANWLTCAQLLPHGEACVELIERYDLFYQEAAELLLRMANYLRKNCRYSEAEPLYQRALLIQEQNLGTEHLQIIYPLYGLANLYKRQGKYTQAELLDQRALRIAEQQLEPEHPLVITVLNNLAGLYERQGKYTQAEPLYQRALRIREQQLGPEHLDMASSLNNLAILYERQGKYTQAEPLYQRALRIYKQSLGSEHSLVQRIQANYASLLQATGYDVEARKLKENS